MTGKVFDELTCPDCGGQIGVAEASSGVKPCTCFAAAKASRPRPLPDEPDPQGMAGNQSTGLTGGKKLCRVCAKDLTGRSRLKDEKGYICKKCSDAEYEAEAEAERDAIECPECHRRLKPAAFVEYRGTLICKRCLSGHQETDRLQVAKLGELTLHKANEKRNLIVMASVAAALGVALVVKTFVFGW